MSTRSSKCSVESVPQVKLALSKDRCLRRGSLPRVMTARGVGEFLSRHYGCEAQEKFLAVGLNSRNEVLGVLEISTGGLDQTQVDPRVLFSGLLLMGAGSFIIAHNHPSGDPEPSAEDVSLTQQLKSAAKTLGIRLVDHIVIPRGGGEVVSFAARRLLESGQGLAPVF